MLSDDKLIDQIKYGNERAAEELITRYYASILRYCRWHCSNEDVYGWLAENAYKYGLARLFFQTVHSVNAKDYTKEQLDVYPYDREFTKRLMIVVAK